MSEKQLRKLDAWIAEHVFGFDMAKTSVDDIEHYTTDPAEAMQVLEELLILHNGEPFEIWRGGSGMWHLGKSKAETLPLAICLFAKELFAKEEK